jgi:hypothetical protein
MVIAAGGLAWLSGLGVHTAFWAGIAPPLLLLELGLGSSIRRLRASAPPVWRRTTTPSEVPW